MYTIKQKIRSCTLLVRQNRKWIFIIKEICWTEAVLMLALALPVLAVDAPAHSQFLVGVGTAQVSLCLGLLMKTICTCLLLG
jgi:hypothetical protein